MAAARMEEGDERNTGSPAGGAARANRRTREGKVGPDRVAERPVVPVKPGNAGGGKGPQVEAMAKGSRLTGVADGLARTIQCAVDKAPFLSGCESRPATVVPAGSSRSGRWR